MDWILYTKGCSEDDKQRIKQAMHSTDTFTFVFPGNDLNEWYHIRKDALRAGFLEGCPAHLKDPPSEAILSVTFSPKFDEVYSDTCVITLEHNRQYEIALSGQGTNDEE